MGSSSLAGRPQHNAILMHVATLLSAYVSEDESTSSALSRRIRSIFLRIPRLRGRINPRF
jgi:hypothetical protein